MDIFEEQGFYELMQDYRHSPAAPQDRVVSAFGAVKTFAKTERDETAKNFGLWLGQNLKKNKGKTIDELYEIFKTN